MSSCSSTAAKKRQAPKDVGRICSVREVDPALEDPQLLETIREKNKDALAYLLDPSHGHSQTSKFNTTETAWFLSTASSHHVTCNPDLLTDVTPVSDRWVRGILGGPPLQVLARGSVNSNGIVLQDVWFVPDGDMNVVSGIQLGLAVHFSPNGCSLRHPHDGSVVGHAHNGAYGLLEVDYIKMSSGAVVWYIASNVSQHMTGNLELLTDFNPVRPSYTVQTHTGARLQVCGKGSVNTGEFSIPNVSYVPGLGENIVSISQLTDSGFSVTFGPNHFTVNKRNDGKVVGSGTHGGTQLFHLDSLEIPIGK